MSWEKISGIVAIVALVLAVLVFGFDIFGFKVQQAIRQQDQQREDQFRREHQEREDARAIPKLKYEGGRFENGFMILTFKNLSPEADAAVTMLTLEITDPQMLRRIERKHPKPTEFWGPAAGELNNVDEVGFSKGYWIDPQTYRLNQRVGYHVRAGGVNDFSLSLDGEKWRGEQFNGTLIIDYDGLEPLTLPDVTVMDPRRR